ncbi:MAG TPA: hypothetical protein DEB06_09200 [Phycisphaerales bacterium]|nr:hypothetical protein [Phycisphaerales bacterium]
MCLLMILGPVAASRDARANDSDSPPDPTPEQEADQAADWPGFDAPASVIVEFLLVRLRESRQFFAKLGMTSKDFEDRLKAQIHTRGEEFSGAILAWLPWGFAARTSLNEQEEGLRVRLDSARKLPYLAMVLPEPVAQRTLSTLQNRAAMLGWHCADRFRSKMQREPRPGDYEELSKSDPNNALFILDCLTHTQRVAQDSVRAAATPGRILPRLVHIGEPARANRRHDLERPERRARQPSRVDASAPQDLRAGRTLGRTACKVHIDGHNLLPAIQDSAEWPRKDFISRTDAGSVAALRSADWRVTFLRQTPSDSACGSNPSSPSARPC